MGAGRIELPTRRLKVWWGRLHRVLYSALACGFGVRGTGRDYSCCAALATSLATTPTAPADALARAAVPVMGMSSSTVQSLGEPALSTDETGGISPAAKAAVTRRRHKAQDGGGPYGALLEELWDAQEASDRAKPPPLLEVELRARQTKEPAPLDSAPLGLRPPAREGRQGHPPERKRLGHLLRGHHRGDEQHGSQGQGA